MPFQNNYQSGNNNNAGSQRNGTKINLIKNLRTKDGSLKIVVWKTDGTPGTNGQPSFSPNTMLIITPSKLIGKDPTTGKATYQQVNIKDGCVVFVTKEPLVEFLTNVELFKEEKILPKFAVEGPSFKLDVNSNDSGIVLGFVRKLKDGREAKNDLTFEFNTVDGITGRKVSYSWELFIKALNIGLTKCIENGKFENPEDDNTEAASSGSVQSSEVPF